MRREIISHLGPPSQTLMSIADQLTMFSQFLVLDAGCGLGRNAVALAARGLSVVCADHDLRRLHTLVRVAPPHITELKRTGARMGQLFPVLTNLNQSRWPFSQNCFGAIICVHFLDTDLFGACRQSLVTGGYLYIETFGGRFVKSFEPIAEHGSGYVYAIICLLCLILAIHYHWRGPAGVFWLLAFAFGFLAAHKLTTREIAVPKMSARVSPYRAGDFSALGFSDPSRPRRRRRGRRPRECSA
jgi:SAM-dependent methyltransferase